jgi:hypothetical protein
MTCRVRSTRENRRFSSLEKRPEDFFHGQLTPGHYPALLAVKMEWAASEEADGETRAGEEISEEVSVRMSRASGLGERGLTG